MRLLLVCLLALPLAAETRRIEVHGHRGAPAVAPENTLPSFREAIRAGADYIEMDVFATRDNALVITHDAQINFQICQGTGGNRPILSMTLEEVRRYDCGSLTLKAFPRQKPVPGTRIPTLDEVLELAKESTVRFNIEIKSSEKWSGFALPPEEISRMVVAAVRRQKLEKRSLIQSFDFRVVKATRAIAPDLAVAALYTGGDRSFADIARETGAPIVTPQFKLVAIAKVKEAHDAGVRIIPWTVDAPEDWDRLIAMGVDGIITNDPGGLVEHLKRKGLR